MTTPRSDDPRAVDAPVASTTDRRASIVGAVAATNGARAREPLWKAAIRTVAGIGLLVSVITVVVQHERPIFTGSTPAVRAIERRIVAAKPLGGPTIQSDSPELQQALRSPKFAADQHAFALDLIATGRIDSARADSIATVAVAEAYRRDVSPAIIFGVMRTENSTFLRGAKSNVGAVGLMQIYPKVWLPALKHLLGSDLHSDSTNMRYGVFILSHYFHPKDDHGTIHDRDYRSALLHYNGCVTGSNTPDCARYPDKVRGFVEREAHALCNGKGFMDCIARPFVAGFEGHPDSVALTAAGGPAAPTLVAGTPPTPTPVPVLVPVPVPPAAPATRHASHTTTSSHAATTRTTKQPKAQQRSKTAGKKKHGGAKTRGGARAHTASRHTGARHD